MMRTISVDWNGNTYPRCRLYQRADEAGILDAFFFWKTTVLLSEKTGNKKPQLPQTFSEPFVSFVCGLAHSVGNGPDAFRLEQTGGAVAVEIKATITQEGFTDIKRDLAFDELFWLSMHRYNELGFEILRFQRSELEAAVTASRTARDRGTISLRRVAIALGRTPVVRGRIGWLLHDEGASQETSHRRD